MDITVNIMAPGICAALEKLAAAITAHSAARIPNVCESDDPAAEIKKLISTPRESAPTTEVKTPEPEAPIPTAARTYTLEDFRTATAPLCDAGKIGDIKNLISSFGISKMADLPSGKYDAFAEGLRGLGAEL